MSLPTENMEERYFRQFAERFKPSQELLFEDIKSFIQKVSESSKEEGYRKCQDDVMFGEWMKKAKQEVQEDILKLIEGMEYKTLGTAKEYVKAETTPNGIATHYTDEFTAKWHNNILSDLKNLINKR